jgi:hypothetical protein
MIIYGSRNKQLINEALFDKCQNCGTQNSIEMHVFQKYAHVFWIPIFPLGKTGVSQCNHCKQVLKHTEMPTSLKQSYENVKAKTKTPTWMYSGLVLIGLLIVFGTYQSKINDEKNAKLILTPLKGDVFEIKTKANQYTLYKVEEVQADSVFIKINNFETNKISGLREMRSKGDSAYSEVVYGFSKNELKTMLQSGEIMDIERK